VRTDASFQNRAARAPSSETESDHRTAILRTILAEHPSGVALAFSASHSRDLAWGLSPQAATIAGCWRLCQPTRTPGRGRWPIEPAPILVATSLLNRARRMPINRSIHASRRTVRRAIAERSARGWRRWPIEPAPILAAAAWGAEFGARRSTGAGAFTRPDGLFEEPLPKDRALLVTMADQASANPGRCCLAEPSSARADPPEPPPPSGRLSHPEPTCRGCTGFGERLQSQCCYPFVRADLIRKPSACSGTFDLYLATRTTPRLVEPCCDPLEADQAPVSFLQASGRYDPVQSSRLPCPAVSADDGLKRPSRFESQCAGPLLPIKDRALGPDDCDCCKRTVGSDLPEQQPESRATLACHKLSRPDPREMPATILPLRTSRAMRPNRDTASAESFAFTVDTASRMRSFAAASRGSRSGFRCATGEFRRCGRSSF